MADKILTITNPFELKKMGKTELHSAAKWESTHEKVLFDLMKSKFEQNKSLSDKLCNTGDLVLYEAVKDRKFGVGFNLRDCDKITNTCPGLNKTGQALMSIRSTLRKK